MNRIVALIPSLEQHFSALSLTPEIYRPHLPELRGELHLATRLLFPQGGPESAHLRPVESCSYSAILLRRMPPHLFSSAVPHRSPEMVQLGAVQQAVLLMLLAGCSLNAVSLVSHPCRQTVGRWWRCLPQ